MKILLVQLKRAGDVILTTPLPPLVKRCWPEAQVDFLVEKPFAPLLQHNPSIDQIQLYDKANLVETFKNLRRQRYDEVFDFQSSPRSAVAVLASGARHTAGYNVPFWGRTYGRTVPRPGVGSVVQGKVSLLEPVIGAIGEAPPPRIFLTPEEERWADGIMLDASGKKTVGLISTHRRASRRWPAGSFAEVARQLSESGYTVRLFWGPGEKEYVESIQRDAPQALMAPPSTLREMAALLSRCDVVVTNDNGPMHIAVAVGTPTITIYGPTDPTAWNPGGPRHAILRMTGLSCLGCNLNACPFSHECMHGVKPAQVVKACEQRLKVPDLRGVEV